MTKQYQLGTVIFEEIGGGYYLASLPTRTIKLALFELLAMRATPLNDKPERLIGHIYGFQRDKALSADDNYHVHCNACGADGFTNNPEQKCCEIPNKRITPMKPIKTPIDDKPEKCECVKNSSGEWKIYSLNSDGQCIHCGRQISPKQEKIEPSNIDFKSKTDWQVHFIMLENKINEVIKAVNSLKGE